MGQSVCSMARSAAAGINDRRSSGRYRRDPLLLRRALVHRLHHGAAHSGFARGDQGCVLVAGDGGEQKVERVRLHFGKVGPRLLAVRAFDRFVLVENLAVADQGVRLGSADFDFIPHFEEESRIIADIKASKNHIFGHFGFDGCVANGSYEYESYIKRSHFGKNRLVFLGHIHKPKIYGKNIFVLGTAHSTSFGEANAQKYVHELIIRNGNVEVVRKPINFGIRHVTSTLDTLEDYSQKYDFNSFFTILRVKMDSLDAASEKELIEALLRKHKVKHLEVVFDDVLPKYEASHVDYDSLLTVDDTIIHEYIDNANTIFSKPELLTALEEIRSHET